MAIPYTTLRFEGSPEQIEEHWLEARKKGIGGSDAAAILGLNPYTSAIGVWLKKTGRIDDEDLSSKESVHWGNVLEDVVAKEFAERHPDFKVKRLNAMLRSKAHPFMQASLDRIITDENGRKGVLEIKTAGARRADDWEDGIPDYYLPQVTHYLAVTGFEFFAMAVLIGGQSYKEFFSERDDEEIERLIQEEEEFWGFVTMDEMPPATGGIAAKAEAKDLVEAIGPGDDEFLDVLDDDHPEIAELQAVNAQLKELEERRSTLSNKIKQLIGDKKGVRTPTLCLSWPRTESKRFNAAAFKADNPELYEQYSSIHMRDNGLRFRKVR